MKPFTLNHVVVQQLFRLEQLFDLGFYVRSRACEKRESGKEP